MTKRLTNRFTSSARPLHSKSSRKRYPVSPSPKPFTVVGRESGPTLGIPRSSSPSALANQPTPEREVVSCSPNGAVSSSDLYQVLVKPPVRARVRSQRQWQGRGLESITVIAVNLALILGAMGGLMRLLPLQVAQHNRLHVLEEEVKLMSNRVNRLQETLDRSMDPSQKEALIKERFNYVPPNQLHVRLVEPLTQEGIVATDPQATPEAKPERAVVGWMTPWTSLGYVFKRDR